MTKKIKVLTLSDHPLSPSGVGTQTRYIIEALLKTGKFQVLSLGGAIKHKDYTPRIVDQWGEDWKIIPVDGYGSQEMIRSILRNEKPDILWMMTDPRFYGWLWQIEEEIRTYCPLVYYHVWDNYPYPDFNKVWYDSNDMVVAISKLTHDIVKNVSPDVETEYLPHAVNPQYFTSVESENQTEMRKKMNVPEDKFVVFWNNRNARRKQPGTLIFWFKEFLDRVGKDKAKLIMHTDPNDPNGPNLLSVIENLGLTNGEVQFSTQKIDFAQMASLYNMADVTVNISDAEGFGLSTLESLSCGTPIIVNMTGGLQEQVTDGENWFGIGLQPTSKAVIGSQDIPYIYEDRISGEDFVDALEKIYNMSSEERAKMGSAGRSHVLKNYSFEQYVEGWNKILRSVYDKHGSWQDRKNYKNWYITEV